MQNKLSFEIENLASINKADLDIGKINIIIGKNNTGKSTSSKFLFCLLTAISRERIYLANCDIKNRINQLCYLLKFSYFDDNPFSVKDFNLIEDLLNKPNSNELFDEISHKLFVLSKKINSPALKEMYLQQLKKIQELIEINKNRNLQFVKTFNWLLDSEYAFSPEKQTNVIFKGIDGKHQIVQEIPIKKDFKQVTISTEFYNYFNFDNIVYMDSLSVLEFNNMENMDNVMYDKIPYHVQQISRKLRNTNNKGIYDGEFYKELDDFKIKIDGLIGGKFKYDEENKIFLLEKDGEDYPMQNTSSGLKQLGIIQLLLENRELTENSFLILDEPEVHLHPEFQVQFAEILVLLAKNLNITVYVNTHSPFLAEAFEVYSKYYMMYDKTNFYLTCESENKDKFDYILMDDMDIMKVYNNLGNSFDTLNEIRFKTELRND